MFVLASKYRELEREFKAAIGDRDHYRKLFKIMKEKERNETIKKFESIGNGERRVCGSGWFVATKKNLIFSDSRHKIFKTKKNKFVLFSLHSANDDDEWLLCDEITTETASRISGFPLGGEM